MVESGLLKALLLNVIFGGTAGVIVWRFVESKACQKLRDRLANWLGYYGLKPPEVTRYLAMASSLLISSAICGMMATLSMVTPFTAESRHLILRLFTVAYITSQICHARRKTRISLHRRSHPVDSVTTTLD